MSPAPLGARRRAAAYVGLARAEISSQTIYRSSYLYSLLGLLLKVYLLTEVWKVVYPASRSATGQGGQAISLSEQIAYSTLATVQYFLFNPWQISNIPERVRTGKVAVDLARPVRYTAQAVFGQAGVMLANLPFAVAVLPLAVLVGGARPPASVGAGFAYAVSLVPAFAITLLTGTLIGLTAFWTLEIDGMITIYQMVGQFLAGALIPLWFMPGWLSGLAGWLPFHATTYTPISLYLGHGGNPVEAIAVQCAWWAVLWAALRAVSRRALRRVTVQGG